MLREVKEQWPSSCSEKRRKKGARPGRNSTLEPSREVCLVVTPTSPARCRCRKKKPPRGVCMTIRLRKPHLHSLEVLNTCSKPHSQAESSFSINVKCISKDAFSSFLIDQMAVIQTLYLYPAALLPPNLYNK